MKLIGKKGSKMVAICCAIALLASILCVVTAHAADDTIYTVEFRGKSSTPVFIIDGEYVYCLQPDATHPTSGVKYRVVETEEDYSIFDEMAVNFLLSGREDDFTAKVIGQNVWSKLRPETNYRAMTQILLGEDAITYFDMLNEPVNTKGYNVVYTVYESVETDEMGNPYQMLIKFDVLPVEPDVSPDPEPETTDPEITEPEVTEPEITEPEITEPEITEPEITEPEVTEPEITEPEVTEPEITEPETTDPEITEPEVTEPEITEPKEEESQPKVTVPVLEEGGFIPQQPAPKLGDGSSSVFLIVLMVISAAAFVIVNKKKSKK